MRILFILFIVVPILEMFVLIKVGGTIGALATIGLVLLTAIAGMALLRQQGFSTLARAQTKLQGGEIPMREIVEGICLAVGGALLLTPGFITDAIGFICLIPGLRHVFLGQLIALLKPYMVMRSASAHSFSRDTLEGEYKRED